MTILTAEAFEELERYIENPTCTPAGEALIREAARRQREQAARCAGCPHADCCRKHGGMYQ